MKIIDLSLPVGNEMRSVDVRTAKTIANEGWNATTLELYSHCGTHMDASVHFVDGAATIDEQDLSVCVGQFGIWRQTQQGSVLTSQRLSRT